MNKPAAIYARVSSDRQKENHTIASQTAALTRPRALLSARRSIVGFVGI
jgi:DNA invertase Pin-like site-specific DNA recombinase